MTTLCNAQQAKMVKVEPLTENEKKELKEAQDKVNESQHNFEIMKTKIAAAHQMGTEHWMEWSRWVEFDGDFIIQRYLNNMELNFNANR